MSDGPSDARREMEQGGLDVRGPLKNMLEDVTKLVDFADNDGEHLPLTKCVCGAEYRVWEQIVSIYKDHPWTCPTCGAKLIFTVGIRVFRI